MANRYVYSGAGGAGTGADWANAHVTLAAAITASTAGDVFFVASDHAEAPAGATTLSFKGTAAAPDRILSVNRAGSVPPVAADILAGASVTCTAGLTVQGSIYANGVTWAAGNGSASSAASIVMGGTSNVQHLEDCQFHNLTTSSSALLNLSGTTSSLTSLVRPRFRFGHVSQKLTVTGRTHITGPSATSILAAGGSTPTNLVNTAVNTSFEIFGADLSDISGTIFEAISSTNTRRRAANCKLHASATIASTPTLPGPIVEAVACHSAGNVARNERYSYEGTLTTETTILRTAGASDGTTAHSWKIVTTANAERDFPFETFEGVVWNDTTGASKTLTVHTVTDNVTLTDAEVWLEVEYLGSSGSPISTLITDANATVLTTAANQASDSGEAWTTTGLTTPVKQKLEVTFTPQMAGPIRWRVKVAKVSTTVYVCPKPDLS